MVNQPLHKTDNWYKTSKIKPTSYFLCVVQTVTKPVFRKEVNVCHQPSKGYKDINVEITQKQKG